MFTSEIPTSGLPNANGIFSNDLHLRDFDPERIPKHEPEPDTPNPDPGPEDDTADLVRPIKT